MSPLHAILWSVPPQDARSCATVPLHRMRTHTCTPIPRDRGGTWGHRSSAHLLGFFRAFCRWHPCRDWLVFPLPGSGSSFFGSSSGRPLQTAVHVTWYHGHAAPYRIIGSSRERGGGGGGTWGE
eukprot:jgi/Botrbrau1/21865/Bobra.0893s0001.1